MTGTSLPLRGAPLWPSATPGIHFMSPRHGTSPALEAAKTAVAEAGPAILACPHPQGGFPASGQTAADRQAHRVVVEVLTGGLTPEIPIASEEGDRRVAASRYWLVDPLDGTKEYVAGNGQYTVNVALIEDGYPVLAAVQVPVTGELYWGSAEGGAWTHRGPGSGAKSLPIEAPGAALRVLTSRSHSSPAWSTGSRCCAPRGR